MVTQDADDMEQLAICEENILVKITSHSREEIIQKLGTLLYQNGYVNETYIQAVLEREQVFPTGLKTNILGFAIPHADTEHVKRSAIAVATLNKQVVFREMGNPQGEIAVDIVMMLAIQDPKMVVHVLRRVISILEDEAALNALLQAKSPSDVKETIVAQVQKPTQSILD